MANEAPPIACIVRTENLSAQDTASNAVPQIDAVQLVENPAEGMRLYTVELPNNPCVHVAAFEKFDAIEAYKKHCGIISTIHEFKVMEVEPATPEGEFDPQV